MPARSIQGLDILPVAVKDHPAALTVLESGEVDAFASKSCAARRHDTKDQESRAV